jgi:hypothetical protein
MRLAVCCVLVLTLAVRAERPPEPRAKADVVITGKVVKVTTKDSKFFGDGVSTDFTATVKVEKVEKGDVNVGDTVEVRWYAVTKSPSKPPPAAYGHDHGVRAKDRATFWLMGKKSPWTVIYNRDGVAKVKE